MKLSHLSFLIIIIAAFIYTGCESMTGSEASTDQESAVLSESIDITANATAAVWYQGFEVDTDGWNGTISRLASGTNGINASEEDYYANVTEGYTFFDGPRDTWPGDWYAEVDVYLDPSWASGTGFDYTVAAYGSDGAHQRDYIFHVGVVDGTGLVVNGSNNTDFSFNEYKLLNENDGNYHVVQNAGWYTLQHHFYDDGGSLSVDLNLLDSSGTTLFTATRSNVSDTIPAEVGGNGYGWFTYISVDGGINMDALELILQVPEPETKNDCKKGGWEDYGFKNQGQCVRFVNTGKDSR